MALSSASSVQAASPVAGPLIALFTDYGWEDSYVAQLKGAILTIAPQAQLLDLTHNVAPFNVAEGAYLLDQSAQEFPARTIFVAVVDPQVGTPRAPILLQTAKDKYYVGPDNGLFSQVIAREGVTKVWRLDRPEFYRGGAGSSTFHGRDIFGPVAAHLAAGIDPDRLGSPMKAAFTFPVKEPNVAGSIIATEVLHIDRYGNIILNLRSDSEAAAKLKPGTLVKIAVGREDYSGPFVKTYGDVPKNRLALLYGGNGLLEIALNQGSAAKELKAAAGTAILLKP